MSERPLQVIPAEEITRRFDKMEAKIDKLSDAMITLARNEEKLSNVESHLNTLTARMNRHSDRVDALELDTASNTRTSSNIMKLYWIITAAVVGVVAKMFY